MANNNTTLQAQALQFDRDHGLGMTTPVYGSVLDIQHEMQRRRVGLEPKDFLEVGA